MHRMYGDARVDDPEAHCVADVVAESFSVRPCLPVDRETEEHPPPDKPARKVALAPHSNDEDAVALRAGCSTWINDECARQLGVNRSVNRIQRTVRASAVE